jgi:ATP-binding cassette subfamily B protein
MKKDQKRATLKETFSAINFMYNQAREFSKKYMLEFWLGIIFSVVSSVALTFIPTATVYFVSEQPDIKMFAICLSSLFAGFVVSQVIQEYCTMMRTWDSTFTRIAPVYGKIYGKCLSCDYVYFEGTKAREDKQKALNSVNSNWVGAELLLKQVPAVITDLLNLIVFICLSSLVTYQIALILLAMTVSNVILGFFANKVFDEYIEKADKSSSKNNYYYTTAKNELQAKDIRNYNLAKMFTAAFKKEYNLANHYTRIQRYIFILPNLSDSLFGFLRDFVAYSLLITAVLNKTVTISQFTLMISVINSLSTYLSEISSKAYDILTASKEVGYLKSFIEAPSQLNHAKGLDVATLNRPVTIEFKDVSFTYPEAKAPTISHLSFKVASGEKIALVGENGAGKTTIVKLLSGLYKPTEGQILIDGHSIEEFNIDDYYSLLSVINQDIQVVGFATLKNNVTCTEEESKVDHDKFLKAIKEAGLEEKIASLPKKENTYLTQNFDPKGVLLSGGETQKLMLARALYKDGAILLLDEPTSALDPIAEGELYKKYADFTKGKSSIFISHRLSSTRFCDRILYLKDGQIIEEGTHEELMKKNGEYAKVFNVQAHYYKEGGKEDEDNHQSL